MSFYENGQEEWADAFNVVKWYADASAANYRKLNRFLRDGAGLLGKLDVDFCNNQVRLLDELARAAPAVESPGLTLWRGFSSFPYVQHIRELEVIADSRPMLIKDEAYMSCSLSESVGNFYARRHALLPEDLDDAVLLRIHVPAGTRVICVFCSGAGVPNEEEVLLQRGSVIRVEQVLPRRLEASVWLALATLVVNDTTCEAEQRP